MKNKTLLLLLIISTSLTSYSQTLIYKGDKQYPATNTWSFQINGTAWNTTLEVSIGKDGNAGILMLQNETTPQSYIGGAVYVFLSDGTRITCADKNVKDKVDNKSVVLYKFSAEEIQKLKTYYITSIRFTIQPSSNEGFNGNKTADNKKNIYSFYGDKKENNYYETSDEVSALFQ